MRRKNINQVLYNFISLKAFFLFLMKKKKSVDILFNKHRKLISFLVYIYIGNKKGRTNKCFFAAKSLKNSAAIQIQHINN